MRAQLLHLSGPLRGRTATHREERIVIGSDTAAEAWIPSESVAGRHAEIEFQEASCSFHLRRRDGRTFVNQQEVDEVVLQDGDLLEFGIGGPQVRFRIYVPPGRVCKPVRRMLADAGDVRRRSGAAAGTRTLVRDLLTQATPQLKVGFPVLVIGVVVLLAYGAGWLGAARNAQRRERADAVRDAELHGLRDELAAHRRELERMAAASGVIDRIQREFAASICLIHGILGLRDRDGSWLIGPDGEFEREYTGTGFVAGPGGQCLTNRHVAAPWSSMPDLEALIKLGLKPEFRHLTATFSGRKPVPIDPATIKLRPDKIDVALFRVPLTDLRPLPLHGDDLGDLTDRRAIVVGYPTGLAALLAKADDSVVEDLQRRSATIAEVIDMLAGLGPIEPILTEGVIGNVQADKLVYDASTTYGGSGGPVFATDGTVIGINFAVMPGFVGANFGVPIRLGRALLEAR